MFAGRLVVAGSGDGAGVRGLVGVGATVGAAVIVAGRVVGGVVAGGRVVAGRRLTVGAAVWVAGCGGAVTTGGWVFVGAVTTAGAVAAGAVTLAGAGAKVVAGGFVGAAVAGGAVVVRRADCVAGGSASEVTTKDSDPDDFVPSVPLASQISWYAPSGRSPMGTMASLGLALRCGSVAGTRVPLRSNAMPKRSIGVSNWNTIWSGLPLLEVAVRVDRKTGLADADETLTNANATAKTKSAARRDPARLIREVEVR